MYAGIDVTPPGAAGKTNPKKQTRKNKLCCYTHSTIHQSGEWFLYCTSCRYQGAGNDTFCYQCGNRLTPLPPEVNREIAKTQGPNSWRTGQVALGVFLILVSILPIGGLSIWLGSVAGRFQDAVTIWESSHLMGFVILMVVWYLGLRPFGLGLASLGLKAPTTPRAELLILTAGTLGASLGAPVES